MKGRLEQIRARVEAATPNMIDFPSYRQLLGDSEWLLARLTKAEAHIERMMTDGVSRACGDDEAAAFLGSDE